MNPCDKCGRGLFPPTTTCDDCLGVTPPPVLEGDAAEKNPKQQEEFAVLDEGPVTYEHDEGAGKVVTRKREKGQK